MNLLLNIVDLFERDKLSVKQIYVNVVSFFEDATKVGCTLIFNQVNRAVDFFLSPPERGPLGHFAVVKFNRLRVERPEQAKSIPELRELIHGNLLSNVRFFGR